MSSASAAFTAQEAITAGEWDRHLAQINEAVRDRIAVTNPHKPPWRTLKMIENGQVWAWMQPHDGKSPQWEIRGTGVKL